MWQEEYIWGMRVGQGEGHRVSFIRSCFQGEDGDEWNHAELAGSTLCLVRKHGGCSPHLEPFYADS